MSVSNHFDAFSYGVYVAILKALGTESKSLF